MPTDTSYLARREEIIQVVKQARADCGIHWMVKASGLLDIPQRTLYRLCKKWRVHYTNRQWYEKNKQHILDVVARCRTLDEASKQLGIPRSTLYRKREKWEGGKVLKYRRGRRFVGSTGIRTTVLR